MSRYSRKLGYVIALLISCAVLAEELDLSGHPGLPPTPTNIRDFTLGGRRMVPDGACEKILSRVQLNAGRELTRDELTKYVLQAVSATAEELVFVAAPSPRRVKYNCFTARMLVLTPSGHRPIGDLRPGDEVISYNFGSKETVTNKIFAISEHYNEVVRVLSDLTPPIEVTCRHKFLTGQGLEHQFRAIEEIAPTENIFTLLPTIKQRAGLRAQNRGRYDLLPDTHTVYDLQLVAEPRNFILEGVVVHNSIEKL